MAIFIYLFDINVLHQNNRAYVLLIMNYDVPNYPKSMISTRIKTWFTFIYNTANHFFLGRMSSPIDPLDPETLENWWVLGPKCGIFIPKDEGHVGFDGNLGGGFK